MTSAGAFSANSLTTKHRLGVRSRSNDSLQSLEYSSRRIPEAVSVKQSSGIRIQEVSKVKPVSRVELLLLAKTSRSGFIPEQETDASHKINQAIKACSEWSQVQKVVAAHPELTSDNLAFAIYRLGCFQAFASKKRSADLKASHLVPQLFEKAMKQVNDMEPASLVLLLDGCARLQHQPTETELSTIAAGVQQNVYSMYASQLPLVLWAFSSLRYNPGPQVLLSLEAAVGRQASELLPQGMALVLSSFHAANHQLNDFTINHLSDIVQRKLLLFKPSELATCLKVLSAQGYNPTPSFLSAVMERSGKPPDQSGITDLAAAGGLPNLAFTT